MEESSERFRPRLAQPKPRLAAGTVTDLEPEGRAAGSDELDRNGAFTGTPSSHDRSKSRNSGFDFRATALHSPSPPPRASIERRGSPFRASTPSSPPPSELMYNVPPIPRRSSPALNSSRKASASPVLPPPPPSPSPMDLSTFSDACNGFYFEQDEDSRQVMESTLSKAPQNHRPTYMKLQARIRSQYHEHVAREGKQRIERQIQNAIPCSRLPDAGEHPRSATAKRVRHEKLSDFVKAHCGSLQIGTRPFFGALKLLLMYQARGQDRGGAGDKVAVWAFDEAVLLESGGTEFEKQAIQTLIGVLGFDVASQPAQRSQVNDDSDPFSNPNPNKGSPTQGRLSLSTAPYKSSPLATQTEFTQKELEPLSPSENQPIYRIWKMPSYLQDPELRALAAVIPDSVIASKFRDIFTEPAQTARKTAAQDDLEAAEQGRSAAFAGLDRQFSVRSLGNTLLPPDEKAVGMVQLPTGYAWRTDEDREVEFKGGLLSRILGFIKRTLLRRG